METVIYFNLDKDQGNLVSTISSDEARLIGIPDSATSGITF